MTAAASPSVRSTLSLGTVTASTAGGVKRAAHIPV